MKKCFQISVSICTYIYIYHDNNQALITGSSSPNPDSSTVHSPKLIKHKAAREQYDRNKDQKEEKYQLTAIPGKKQKMIHRKQQLREASQLLR